MQRLGLHRLPFFGDYKGQAINEIDELWQQISHRGVFRMGRNLAS